MESIKLKDDKSDVAISILKKYFGAPDKIEEQVETGKIMLKFKINGASWCKEYESQKEMENCIRRIKFRIQKFSI